MVSALVYSVFPVAPAVKASEIVPFIAAAALSVDLAEHRVSSSES